MSYGIKVKIKDSEQYGFIVRRLNAQAYEIGLENSDEVVILSPEEFIEVGQDE